MTTSGAGTIRGGQWTEAARIHELCLRSDELGGAWAAVDADHPRRASNSRAPSGEVVPSKLEPHGAGGDHDPQLELVAAGRADDDRLVLSHGAHELRLLRSAVTLEPPRPVPERAPRPEPLTLGLLAARHAARTPRRDALHPGLPIGHALDADRGRSPRHHGARAADTTI